jgi:hypothetical protein
MASTASAAEEKKEASWAELAPIPARMPPAKPNPMEPAPCQPANFIPGETSTKRLPGGAQMSVQPVKKLSGGYELTRYEFSCENENLSTHVLDVSRNGKRHALYQHVLGFSAHPTKPLLYLFQSELKGKRHQEFTGLVNLDGKKKVALPPLPCVFGSHATFSGDRLITYSEPQAQSPYRTDVCVWSLDGKLKARLSAELDWHGADRYVLLDAVGLLPRQPGVFYAIQYSREEGRCEIRLQSLEHAQQFRRIDLGVLESSTVCHGHASKLEAVSLEGQ